MSTNTLKNRITNLLTVKSIVTLSLCGTYIYLTIIGKITSDQFTAIFTTIIGFYFGTQYEKKEK